MAAKPNRPSIPAPEKVEHRLQQIQVIAELQSSVEQVEHALHGLRDLAKLPGYQFVGRMIPGYVWAIEQLHELNTGLIAKCEAKRDSER